MTPVIEANSTAPETVWRTSSETPENWPFGATLEGQESSGASVKFGLVFHFVRPETADRDSTAERFAKKRIANRIAVLRQETREPNWDSERSAPVLESEWNKVQNVTYTVVQKNPSLAPPLISPCGDGSVHVKWKADDKRFYLETKGPGFLWTKRKASGERSYGESNSPEEVIRTLLQFLE